MHEVGRQRGREYKDRRELRLGDGLIGAYYQSFVVVVVFLNII